MVTFKDIPFEVKQSQRKCLACPLKTMLARGLTANNQSVRRREREKEGERERGSASLLAAGSSIAGCLVKYALAIRGYVDELCSLSGSIIQDTGPLCFFAMRMGHRARRALGSSQDKRTLGFGMDSLQDR